MNSLAGYGSDEDENDRYDQRQPSVSSSSGTKRPDSDDNYEAVNMDMSEDSQEESEPELPQAEPEPPKQPSREDRRDQDNRGNDDKVRGRDDRDRDRNNDRGRNERDRNDKRDKSRDDRERRDDRFNRPERSDRDRRPDRGGPPKRGLLGDRPEQKETKLQSLLDIKPFGGDIPPSSSGSSSTKSYDARDAVSPRFVDRDRERERDRDRQGHRSDDRRGDRHRHERRSRSRDRSERSKSRGQAYPPAEMHPSSSNDRRASPPAHGEFRPSYKVNKKLEVMEKMGLQIKTPDGSMATAQQLRQAACESGSTSSTTSQQLPSYYNPTAVNANKILTQVQKRKLLWSNKKVEAPEEAAKWTGTRFAQDNDGKQTNKFMRLMGIKDPAAVAKPEVPTADPIKKQEELFQAMQAQYEVARATTHTMRGVGLGFQRGPI